MFSVISLHDFYPVQDVDLTFWRSYEEINHDQQLFLDNGEWELVSVLSECSILQTQTGSFAQVQFHVCTRNVSPTET